MRLSPWISLAAGLSLLAGCKDSSDSSAMRPTTSGSASSAAPADPSPMARTGDTSAAADSTKKDTTARGNTATGDSATGMAGRMATADNSQEEATGHPAPATAGASASPQSVTGTLATASADEVSVDTANQPGLKLKVNASTTVTLDGKKASASQLQEGALVRASYQLVGDQPTALRIEAKSKIAAKGKLGADPTTPSSPDKQ